MARTSGASSTSCARSDRLFGGDVHAGRVGALVTGVAGVPEPEQLGIHANGLTAVRGLVDKLATEQVDRLIANEKLDHVPLGTVWAEDTLAGLDGVVFVSLDWTEIEDDDQSRGVASPQGSGRATPLLWTTVRMSGPKGRSDEVEDEPVAGLAESPPVGLRVVVIADRGVCDHALIATLTEVHDLDFIIPIRIRGMGWTHGSEPLRRVRMVRFATHGACVAHGARCCWGGRWSRPTREDEHLEEAGHVPLQAGAASASVDPKQGDRAAPQADEGFQGPPSWSCGVQTAGPCRRGMRGGLRTRPSSGS